jgi:hypothetical protein
MLVVQVRVPVKRRAAACGSIPLDANLRQIHKDMRNLPGKEREAPRGLERSQSRRGQEDISEMDQEEQKAVVDLFPTVPPNEEGRGF